MLNLSRDYPNQGFKSFSFYYYYSYSCQSAFGAKDAIDASMPAFGAKDAIDASRASAKFPVCDDRFDLSDFIDDIKF